jgi:hypothetical protein
MEIMEITKNDMFLVWNYALARREKTMLWKAANYASPQSLTKSISYGRQSEAVPERITKAVFDVIGIDNWFKRLEEAQKKYDNSLKNNTIECVNTLKNLSAVINSSCDESFIETINELLPKLLDLGNNRLIALQKEKSIIK